MIPRTGIGLLDGAVGKARRLVAERFVRSRIVIPSDFRAVSFCFDDFPVTAADSGARMLESFGHRGTFYTCFGKLGEDSPSGRLASIDDVRALHERGHEIGCHTFDHANCAFIGRAEAARTCGRNREIAADHGIQLAHFAFPQGGMRASTKRVIGSQYGSARCSQPGTNRGVADAHALRGIGIYEHLDKSAIHDPIETVARDGGWLIFYTHDVGETPSNYGTSKNRLGELISAIAEKNIPIRTVGETVRLFERR